MAEDATSELSERAIVCDQVLYSTRSLLKSHLRRHTRLCDCKTATEDTALDRLPRFRFGGNRGTNSKARDKKDNEQRLREITDRLKRGPVPPPRNRHVHNKTITQEASTLPTRSASFSQVDYSTDDNKYVRRRPQATPHNSTSYSTDCASLPRAKIKPADLNNVYDETPEENDEEKPEQLVPTPEESEKLKAQEKRRDKSRRRKGMYISQWPDDGDIDDNLIINQLQDCNFLEGPSSSPEIVPKLQINSEVQQDDSNSTEPTSPDDAQHQALDWPNDQDKSDMRKALLRVNSFSESESDQIERRSDKFNVPSDVSDTESRINVDHSTTRRYSKRPLRGPYGQMLEAEMKKPETGRKNQYNDLKFLDDLKPDASSTLSLSPRSSNECPKYNNNNRSKISQSQSIDDSQIKNRLSSLPFTNKLFVQPTSKRKISADNSCIIISEPEQKLVINHQRTTSSPSKLEGLSSGDGVAHELDHLSRGSSEQMILEGGLQKNNVSRMNTQKNVDHVYIYPPFPNIVIIVYRSHSQ